MKLWKCFALATLLTLSLHTFAQTKTFTVNPFRLANGYRVTGSITTDGTVGQLSPANILDWSLTVNQTTDFVWTEKDSTVLNSSGLSTDGKKLMVATSPDGFSDGGTLYFSRGGGGGSIPQAAIIADFTQLSFNMGYTGGLAGWQDEIWGLNYVGLNQRNNIQYRAAGITAQPNVFRICVPTITTSPLLMTMFGTITTDGTVGALTPQNIIAWKVTARNQDIKVYDKTNSVVISALGVTSDGTGIKVAHAGGQFTLGIPGRRPTFVTLADFTDPMFPNGFQNYYVGIFGVMGDRFPLTKAANFTVAK